VTAAEHQRQVVLSRKQRNTAQEQFPQREFVRALPPRRPDWHDVPMQSLKDRDMGPLERARLAVEASRRVYRCGTRPRPSAAFNPYAQPLLSGTK
jgi:hypothetical protein